MNRYGTMFFLSFLHVTSYNGASVDFNSWTWEAKDVTGVSADKASADGAILVDNCLSIAGTGNVYRYSSSNVTSVEIAKNKAGAAEIVIGGTADLVLTIGSTSSSNASAVAFKKI